MRVLSLFSGGGLGDYGLELAGMEIVGQVEIDGYCRKILQLRWPEVPKWGDICSVKVEDLPKCDLISGGFPCQDISFANQNAEGIVGERSGLWKEMLRIICGLRPKYVLVENVPALLHPGMGVVLGDLAESGYNAEWESIPASAIGAPHRRDRVFIVAYTNERRPIYRQTKILATKERKSSLIKSKPSCKSSDTESTGFESGIMGQRQIELRRGYSWNREQVGGQWQVEPSIRRVVNGCPNRVHRLKLLGNGQVVQVVQWIGERVMEFDSI